MQGTAVVPVGDEAGRGVDEGQPPVEPGGEPFEEARAGQEVLLAVRRWVQFGSEEERTGSRASRCDARPLVDGHNSGG
jgi:hypothetical protein